MRLLLKILGWVLALVAVLALAVGGGGYLWLRRSLPQTSGSVRVPGLTATITITRDANAIPHISAQSEADALFGLGYVHAQDRLWQMEYQRRVGYGRLSEVLGPGGLEADRFLRTLGTGRAAQSAYERLDPPTRALLEAYAAGVNAFIEGHRGSLPPEFVILGIDPEPWRPQDSLVWAKMMSWDLGGNWSEELMRADLQQRIGPEFADQLMPASASDDPLILPDGGDSLARGQESGVRSQESGVSSSFGRQSSVASRQSPVVSRQSSVVGRRSSVVLPLPRPIQRHVRAAARPRRPAHRQQQLGARRQPLRQRQATAR